MESVRIDLCFLAICILVGWAVEYFVVKPLTGYTSVPMSVGVTLGIAALLSPAVWHLKRVAPQRMKMSQREGKRAKSLMWFLGLAVVFQLAILAWAIGRQSSWW